MKVLATICIISLLLVSIFSIVWWYDFKNECEDYLKLTGDAPTIEKADMFLEKALNYIERKKMTNGNSAFLFRTPQNDVGIWYYQIKGAKETTNGLLKKIKQDPSSATQLEKDNALMKIREVVLDNSEKGTKVTIPLHITWFPSQILILFWWIISVIGTLICCVLAIDFD